MKVFLLRDVAKVGQKGTVVEVQQGYAHNFLMKNGLARHATKKDEILLSKRSAQQEEAKLEAEKKSHDMVRTIDGKKVTIEAKSNEKGVLFAKLHGNEILEAINKQLTVSVKEEWLQMEKELIEQVGEHEVKVVFDGSKAKVVLEVV